MEAIIKVVAEATVVEVAVVVIEVDTKVAIKTNNKVPHTKLPFAKILSKETANTAINAHLPMVSMNLRRLAQLLLKNTDSNHLQCPVLPVSQPWEACHLYHK